MGCPKCWIFNTKFLKLPLDESYVLPYSRSFCNMHDVNQPFYRPLYLSLPYTDVPAGFSEFSVPDLFQYLHESHPSVCRFEWCLALAHCTIALSELVISCSEKTSQLENVAIANALQLEAARRRAVPIHFNSSPMPSFKSFSLSVAIL